VRVAGGLVRRLVAVVMTGAVVVMDSSRVVMVSEASAHACRNRGDRLNWNRQR
jgi:hypothetical protein